MPGASTHAPPGIIDKHAENLKALGEAETKAEDEHHVSEGGDESEAEEPKANGSDTKRRRNTQEGPATVKKPKGGKADESSDKTEKPQKKPLDIAVRVAWKTKTRLQQAWACADSLNQEMSHVECLNPFVGSTFQTALNNAKLDAQNIINSDFRRAFMTTKNVAACKRFGKGDGFLNSLTAFARDAEPVLTKLEEENDALSTRMEFEKSLVTKT